MDLWGGGCVGGCGCGVWFDLRKSWRVCEGCCAWAAGGWLDAGVSRIDEAGSSRVSVPRVRVECGTSGQLVEACVEARAIGERRRSGCMRER